jgi:hypothetical protein
MKFRIVLGIFCVMVMTTISFAQTTINLFDPVAITASEPSQPPYDFNTATPFGTTSIYLSCPTGATATLSGANGGGFIADNFLTVNGTNICPGGPQGNCFSAVTADPRQNLGQPVETSYSPVMPIDISSLLTEGNSLYTFNLMDYGYALGSSEINLTTTCTQVYPVCHRNNGRRGLITIYVDSLDAVAAHVRHGDTAGVCTGLNQRF